MKHYNEQHASYAVKHGLTRKQKQAHKQARKQRKNARGKQWGSMV